MPAIDTNLSVSDEEALAVQTGKAHYNEGEGAIMPADISPETNDPNPTTQQLSGMIAGLSARLDLAEAEIRNLRMLME